MKRNILLLLMLSLMLHGVTPQIEACTLHRIYSTTVDSAIDDIYQGSMEVTMGSGKTFSGRAANFTMKHNRLCCDFPKIGKMPGKIFIDLPVTLHKGGTLTATPECTAGVMKMPMGIKVKLKLLSLKEARIKGNKISFILQVYGKFMGATFPTTVVFHGDLR